METTGDITQLLREWAEGRDINSNLLFELVYPRLHHVAGAIMHRERQGHILQPTCIVHELFLKLVQQRKLDFENRQHFYSFAARLMRRILVDYARGEECIKRDGGFSIPLTDDILRVESSPENFLDLDRALSELEALDARKCRMVELRLVLGFTAEETADLMEVSKASVDRDLRFSRSWLRNRLAAESSAESDNAEPDNPESGNP